MQLFGKRRINIFNTNMKLLEKISINFFNAKIQEKKIFSFDPKYNNKKILVLFATHVDSRLKLETIKKNIVFFENECSTIMVVNSKNLQYNDELNDFYKMKNINYSEIDNTPTYDFGKWVYLLGNVDYLNYDFIFFTNDSFIIHSEINQFINLTINKNVELYGYTDSTERRYHYQSYLFALKRDAVSKFIYLYNLKKNKIKNQQDVIDNYELTMTDYFETKDCYLKIGNINFHKGLNIFFKNDYLYKLLMDAKLLPFTKIKRLLGSGFVPFYMHKK